MGNVSLPGLTTPSSGLWAKLCPEEIKSQTLPWVLQVRGIATLSVVWAVPGCGVVR